MAARRGVVLTEEHRDLIATGELSLNELAGQLGISRQSLHTNFRRRGWPTTPTGDAVADTPAQPQPAPGSRPRQRPARTRPAATASTLPPAPIALPEAPAAPAMVDLSDDADLTELARRELANVALLGIAEARSILARGKLGAQALKAVVAAAGLADQLLRRAGHDVASTADQVAPRMIISEMTAAEVEAKRAEVEAEHNEAFGIVEDDDELDDGAPQLAAA